MLSAPDNERSVQARYTPPVNPSTRPQSRPLGSAFQLAPARAAGTAGGEDPSPLSRFRPLSRCRAGTHAEVDPLAAHLSRARPSSSTSAGTRCWRWKTASGRRAPSPTTSPLGRTNSPCARSSAWTPSPSGNSPGPNGDRGSFHEVQEELIPPNGLVQATPGAHGSFAKPLPPRAHDEEKCSARHRRRARGARSKSHGG